jgi:transposase
MDQATVLMCHVLAFEYFGGVPEEILYDNMKTAFIYSTSDEKWVHFIRSSKLSLAH